MKNPLPIILPLLIILTACQPQQPPQEAFATALVAEVPFYEALTQEALERNTITEDEQIATALVETLTAASPAIEPTALPPTQEPVQVATAAYTPPPAFDPEKRGWAERDIPYCEWDGEPVLMDVHYPWEMDGRWSVVVVVHGGAWQTGGKGYGIANYFVEPLKAAGYLVVDINYRLAPQYRFPAQIHDVKCAIRHLRANADLYNLNPDAIAMLGFSSGGHLAALAGSTDTEDGFDVGEYADQSSRVQVVVNLSGVINLQYYCNVDTVRAVFGAQDCKDAAVLQPANPTTYLTPDDPPYLIFHGDADTAVPLGFSTDLKDKLDANNIFNMLYVVEGAGHSYGMNDSDPALPTYLKDMEAIMLLFLDMVLQ